MRGAIILAAVLLASPAAAADFGGLALVKLSASDGREAILSLPGVDYGQTSAETALVVDGTVRGVRYRVRAQALGSTEGGWPGQSSVRLKELSWSHRVNDAWSLSVGKQLRSWDSGLAGQPLGFFRAGPDLIDPADSEGRIDGLPMLVVTRLGERVNVEGVVSAPLGGAAALDRLNRRQIALRISGEPAPGLNTALILRQREGTAPGAGFSISYAFAAVELHADGFYGPPEARYAYAGLTDPAPVLHTVSPFVLRNGGPATLRTVAGLSWSITGALSLRAEWSHEPARASGGEWNRYLAGVEAHRAALTGPSAGLAFANLAWDMAGRPSRRDQVYAGLSLNGGDLSYGLSVLTLPADGSGVASATVSWRVARRTSLNGSLSAYFGGERSVFGVLPVGGAAQLSLSRAF